MATLVLLWTVCLLYSGRIQGSSAVSRVFVLKGEDVRLEVQKPDLLKGDIHFFSWTFKGKYTVVSLSSKAEPTVHKSYTGRVEVSTEDYSLGLKNLQEADSGVYTAEMIGEEKHTVAEYNVTVQERVSPVNLTVGSVSSSSDSCNLTVTCSAQDSSINSTVTCDTQTCSQEGGERSEVTSSDASLYVYLSSGSIICNRSNQVSRSEDMKKIEHFCPRVPASTSSHSWAIIIVVAVLVVVCLLLVIVGCIVLRLRRRRCQTYIVRERQEGMGDRVRGGHAAKDRRPDSNLGQVWEGLSLTNPIRGQPVDQDHPADVSVTSGTTIYSTVEPHTAPIGPTETTGSNLPESLYAKIERPARP
ncbi:SLAM family member 9-like isoform X1 [Centroberyx affinis]|uniref:SLAM family member 9-like isoform X1 n=1 Tax=Centroberyx affinis TaxID=166261 RepID=UPI003A5B9612